jgi:hypothetical protein
MTELKKERDELQNEIKITIKKLSDKEIFVLVIIDRILNIIYSLNGPLMAINI